MLEALWYFFPAIVVNLALYAHALTFGPLAHLALDLRRTRGTARWIGDSRGLTSVLITPTLGVLCAAAQGRGEEAVLLAIGAQLGMVANSFVKRRRGLAPGTPSLPWDHLDFVLGAALVASLEHPIPWSTTLWGMVACGWLHRVPGQALRRHLEGPPRSRPSP